jgi:hypothetical protein
VRDCDDFVINGQKVFISNGQLCDFIVLATKTDGSAGAKGVTLFIVESNRPGFQRGRNLEKIGMKAQDTSELFFDNIRIPTTNMLGHEGKGFALMMTKLSQERLAQAIRSATVVETVLDWTVEYTSDRSVFGQKLANFQNTQFKLADLKTKATVARVFTDRCISLFMDGGAPRVQFRGTISTVNGPSCVVAPGGNSVMGIRPRRPSSLSLALTPDRMPSAGDSISMAALSVSITKSGSPLLTCSPSFLSHSTKVPVSMTMSTFGMMTSVAMTTFLPIVNNGKFNISIHKSIELLGILLSCMVMCPICFSIGEFML